MALSRRKFHCFSVVSIKIKQEIGINLILDNVISLFYKQIISEITYLNSNLEIRLGENFSKHSGLV